MNNSSYQLNKDNQAKRLVANASKVPLTIDYNNIRTVRGVPGAFNANIQYNSGVYLSSIKPVLSMIDDNWIAHADNWTISCIEASNRMDESHEHLVCTKLKLKMTEKDTADKSHKITVHLFHTKSKVQVQSSTVVSGGISSAVWFVKTFIEPLTLDHINDNQLLIDQINSDIMSNTMNCNASSSPIKPDATSAKDQSLCCQKCSAKVHKKFSTRRRQGRNWRNFPYLCISCATTSSPLRLDTCQLVDCPNNRDPKAPDIPFMPAIINNLPSLQIAVSDTMPGSISNSVSDDK